MARAQTSNINEVTETTNPHDPSARAQTPAPTVVPQGQVRPVVAGRPPVFGGAGGIQDTRTGNLIANTIADPNGNVIGSALDRTEVSESARSVVAPKKYRVLVGGHLTIRGERHPLRAGKVISDNEYDVRAVRNQGFKLELVTDDNEEGLGPDKIDSPPV